MIYLAVVLNSSYYNNVAMPLMSVLRAVMMMMYLSHAVRSEEINLINAIIVISVHS